MLFQGKDRRIHKVFITRNTEYHTRGGICVRVRDRRSGQWVSSHMALHTRIAGGLRFHLGGGVMPNTGFPSIGESLLFENEGRDLVTSTVIAIERPSREMAATYTH